MCSSKRPLPHLPSGVFQHQHVCVGKASRQGGQSRKADVRMERYQPGMRHVRIRKLGNVFSIHTLIQDSRVYIIAYLYCASMLKCTAKKKEQSRIITMQILLGGESTTFFRPVHPWAQSRGRSWPDDWTGCHRQIKQQLSLYQAKPRLLPFRDSNTHTSYAQGVPIR